MFHGNVRDLVVWSVHVNNGHSRRYAHDNLQCIWYEHWRYHDQNRASWIMMMPDYPHRLCPNDSPSSMLSAMAGQSPPSTDSPSPSLPSSSAELKSPTKLPALSAMPPPPRPDGSHSRSISTATGLRNAKRLSLSFPVQRGSMASTRGHTPSSSVSATPVTPSMPRLVEDAHARQGDANNFLVDLAAQERRVLELKEELQRAEKELERLKKQFAMHEATKKRDQIRHVERLQPLGTALSSVDSSGDDSISSPRISAEHGSKVTTSSGKNTRRTIMSAQGHTRALSLLSPDRNPPPPPQRLARRLTEPDGNAECPSSLASVAPTTGSKSTPAISTIVSGGEAEKESQGIPKDAILRTGRRMAEDLKDGLWTFLDDLRQATVGDEAVNGPVTRTTTAAGPVQAARKRSSTSSLRGSARGSPTRGISGKGSKSPLRPVKDANSLQRQEVETTPKTTSARNGSKLAVPTSPSESRESSSAGLESSPRHSTFDENWDNWDSPTTGSQSPRWSSSTVVSDGNRSPRDDRGRSATSLSCAQAPTAPTKLTASTTRDDIPWPSLTKLSPGKLQRSASTLMDEWERSLTPPPGKGQATGQTTDGTAAVREGVVKPVAEA